jgi:hypothetical protein
MQVMDVEPYNTMPIIWNPIESSLFGAECQENENAVLSWGTT